MVFLLLTSLFSRAFCGSNFSVSRIGFTCAHCFVFWPSLWDAFAQAKGTLEVRSGRDQQSLSYALRLPDDIQADALRLLDVSREVINLTVTALWDRLDEFATRTNSYAYKQVEEMIAPPVVHGQRQWRCEAEQAGRMLRGQAERKQQFALVLPLLEQGMIMPKAENKRAGKDRKAIREVLTQVRDAEADG